MTNDPLGFFAATVELADRVIAGIGPDQFALPTPCAGMDVAGVLDHVIAGNRLFADRIAAAPSGAGTGPALGPMHGSPVPVGDTGAQAEPVARFRDSVRLLADAFAREGMLTTVYPTPLGEVPGSVVVLLRGNEMLVHSWDLARATGQPTDFSPDLVAAGFQFFRRAPIPRGPGAPFAPEQPAPPGASDADRLAAFLGRAA